MSTRNVKENLADHLAIQDLINRYSLGVSQRDWDMLADVFAEDGIWDVDGGPSGAHKHFGRKDVVEALKVRISPAKFVVQMPHSPLIEVNGNSATARTTVQECVKISEGPKGLMMIGTYHDEIIRDKDGEWRFKSRRFIYSYLDMENTWPGQVFINYPNS